MISRNLRCVSSVFEALSDQCGAEQYEERRIKGLYMVWAIRESLETFTETILDLDIELFRLTYHHNVNWLWHVPNEYASWSAGREANTIRSRQLLMAMPVYRLRKASTALSAIVHLPERNKSGSTIINSLVEVVIAVHQCGLTSGNLHSSDTKPGYQKSGSHPWLLELNSRRHSFRPKVNVITK
jgi:hypothetical protein